jgi:hypothetical protein
MSKSKLDSIQIQKIVDSIDVKYKLELINNKIDNNLNIINGVNQFYDSAWLKLIIVISILGVILPFVVQYFQNRNLKLLLEDISKKFENSVKSLQSENQEKFERELDVFDKKFKILEEKNIINESKIQWSTNFLQGRTYLVSKEYVYSVLGFLTAFYVEINNRSRFENNNLRPVLVNIFNCLQNIFVKKDYLWIQDKFKKYHNISIEEGLDIINKQEDKDDYYDVYIKINEELNRLSNLD